jgi:DNA-binding winged helix-turn-helix (wHTH) protein/TolB-like protein/Tfp pilus assembly protein PilF
MLPARKRIYRFADFTLDASEHRLMRGSEEIYLPPKTFETLLFLVDRHGHLVKKNELLDTLWADAFVTENALTRCIKEVREALSDDAHQPSYIRTIPRVGYKFIADVEEVQQSSQPDQLKHFTPDRLVMRELVEEGKSFQNMELAAKPTPTTPVEKLVKESRSSQLSLQTIMLVSIAGVAVVGLAFLTYYLRAKQNPPSLQIKSIAVLPFKPLIADARDESLELGMADTLITALRNVSRLTVRPTSAVRKYTALDQDALAAGREQKVDAVVEGSIQKIGDRIRVTVRLLRVEDGVQLWADTVDQKSTDIFSIQDLISERVAGTVASKLSGEEKQLLTKRYTANTEAYQLYLKGRYFLNKSTEEDFRKSIECFQQALDKDPSYSLAYVGLADSYAQLGSFGLIRTNDSYARAKAASIRALERDEKLAEAHASLGFILTNYYWDWGEAEKQFKQAIELNPNYAMTHNWYSQYLAFMGRSEEAIEEARRSQEIDPLSPWNNSGFVLFLARRYDDAILASQKTLELDENFAVAHMAMGLSYAQKKMYGESISELERAKANPDSRALLAYAHAIAGNRSEARKILDELDQLSKHKYVSPFPVAVAYTGLGENDRAFTELEKAYAERSWAMGMLQVNPVFDPLRSDPRFAALLRRVNLA